MTTEVGGPAPGVLDGYRVVELGVWVAVPSAGALLADWGAEVTKVEPPGGDPYRQVFESIGIETDAPNAQFSFDNRGKRSVVLDLRQPDGVDALHDLLAHADVLLTNLRPDALARLDLEPSAVTARHPRLVYAALSGYGPGGADRDRAGYDVAAFWARSGIAGLMTVPGSPPPMPRGGVGDRTAGLALAAGVCAALLARQRTGRGTVVETSLLATGVFVGGGVLASQLAGVDNVPAPRREESWTPLVNSYRAGDDRWFYLIGVEADRHFPPLVEALGLPELLADERFATAPSRVRHRRQLIALFDEAFAARGLAEWAKRFDDADVWWAPVQLPADVIADAATHDADVFVAMADQLTVASPVRFGQQPPAPVNPAPELGQHTAEVLGITAT